MRPAPHNRRTAVHLKPKSALMSAASWLPRIRCTLRGCSIFNASNKHIVSRLWLPLQAKALRCERQYYQEAFPVPAEDTRCINLRETLHSRVAKICCSHQQLKTTVSPHMHKRLSRQAKGVDHKVCTAGIRCIIVNTSDLLIRQPSHSPIYVVTQEQVVYVCDVPCSVGCSILLKQAHQVTKLTMKVTKDLDRRLHKHGVAEIPQAKHNRQQRGACTVSYNIWAASNCKGRMACKLILSAPAVFGLPTEVHTKDRNVSIPRFLHPP